MARTRGPGSGALCTKIDIVDVDIRAATTREAISVAYAPDIPGSGRDDGVLEVIMVSG